MARRRRTPKMKFSAKLILNQWLMTQFGIDPLDDKFKGQKKPFHELSAKLRHSNEGYDSDGLHNFYHMLVNSELFYDEFHPIGKEQLLRYEENIVRHTKEINNKRSRHVVWKYFQWLTLLFVEIYLDRYFNDRERLLGELNAYLDKFNEKYRKYQSIEPYTYEDLNKICLQNATGSGKTLLMHVNLLQFRHYADNALEKCDISRTILISPNERLSEQHEKELHENNFGFAKRLNLVETSNIDQVDITEITKLGDSEGPNTIATRSLGDQNLLLVDEGHRGMSRSEEGIWFQRRTQLSERGFVFEYSATFAQAVVVSGNVAMEDSYAKSIIFDYSYKWFYEDGFGKDYQILNLPKSFQEVQDIYLCACMLKYFQQLKIYQENTKTLLPFNLEKPLWVFVGNTVSGRKTIAERQTVSDVGQIMLFFARFLSEPSLFGGYIMQILKNGGRDTGLLDKDNNDIFFNSFNYLSKYYGSSPDYTAVYRDILEVVFNSGQGGNLRMDRIKGDSGEVALYLGSANEPFGLINVGDAKGMCDHIETFAQKNMVSFSVTESEFTSAMFNSVKESNSSINILVGSRKFIEGWDCWRVSTMGLLNVGKFEGTQIIQLFGRGVRLKGYDWSLKRSGHVDGIKKPDYIQELETLNVFGIEAKFMEDFSKYLAEEGLPGNERKVEITIPMNVTVDFGKKLKVLRPKYKKDGLEYHFKNDGPVPTLGSIPDYILRNPIVSDWYPRIQAIASRSTETYTLKEEAKLHPKHLSLLDMDKIYFELEQYKREKSWYNLNISKASLRKLLLDKDWYKLYMPKSRLNPDSFAGILLLQQVAIELLRRFTEKFYNYCRNAYMEPRMELRELSKEDDNIPKDGEYTLVVDADDITLINQIKQLKEEIAENKESLIEIGDISAFNYDKHLFQPLFHVRKSGKISIMPIALGESEYQFVKDMLRWTDINEALIIEKEIELYLLRNLSRGRGVGFFEAGNFHPDFILWILKDGKQYINFIEPHGLMHEGVHSPKIQFHKTIKDIERRLGDPDIELNSWVLSFTQRTQLSIRGYDTEEYDDNNVLFMEEEGYLDKVMRL